ncbi:MAG: iron-containing alcohol dehydrogenase [Pirellulales bacterium]
MIPFDFYPRTRIVFGPGKVEMLGELAEELGAARALVVSDPGVVSAGHAQKGIDALTGRGIQSALFDGVEENPTTRNVESGLAVARDFRPDVLIGLGGGSSMDCAKGINFLYSCGGRMQDYWGVGKATRSMLPSIAVPTTAGTGSETQSFALISDPDTHVKMACGDKQASFRVAILDPVLTITQPARVTALTGVDALAHAVETYVTKRRNAVSLAFSREAWQLLAENFAGVLNDPCDLDARSGMQLGACFAGLAIENSMLGAAHALANPLTAHFGVIHGQAVGLMLPHVIRFNGEVFGQWYRDLLECTADSGGMPPPTSGAAGLADFVAGLVRKAGLASRLTDCGVAVDSLPVLARDAAKQWTGSFNPRDVDEASLLEIYRQAM